ncbi:MAG: hypothetical protein SVW02_01210 [Candidatus Nanohaloarchaea archaeon]|nr:hypothetical protein [Candidatus Nanohaloarchaea archaeon]
MPMHDDVEEDLDRIREAVADSLRSADWRIVGVIALVVMLAVAGRAAWEYRAAHTVEYQCAALHLFQIDEDGRLHTTDVAASARFNVHAADQVLQQLAADGFLEEAGVRGIYPYYRLRADWEKVRTRCRGVEVTAMLRSREHWRVRTFGPGA